MLHLHARKPSVRRHEWLAFNQTEQNGTPCSVVCIVVADKLLRIGHQLHAITNADIERAMCLGFRMYRELMTAQHSPVAFEQTGHADLMPLDVLHLLTRKSGEPRYRVLAEFHGEVRPTGATPHHSPAELLEIEGAMSSDGGGRIFPCVPLGEALARVNKISELAHESIACALTLRGHSIAFVCVFTEELSYYYAFDSLPRVFEGPPTNDWRVMPARWMGDLFLAPIRDALLYDDLSWLPPSSAHSESNALNDNSYTMVAFQLMPSRPPSAACGQAEACGANWWQDDEQDDDDLLARAVAAAPKNVIVPEISVTAPPVSPQKAVVPAPASPPKAAAVSTTVSPPATPSTSPPPPTRTAGPQRAAAGGEREGHRRRSSSKAGVTAPPPKKAATPVIEDD